MPETAFLQALAAFRLTAGRVPPGSGSRPAGSLAPEAVDLRRRRGGSDQDRLPGGRGGEREGAGTRRYVLVNRRSPALGRRGQKLESWEAVRQDLGIGLLDRQGRQLTLVSVATVT